MKAKFLLVCAFFGGMGLVSLYLGIDIFVTGTGPRGQNFLLEQYSSPLLKYAVAWLFIGFSIIGLSFPFLLYKGILTLDYYNSSKHVKARNNLILGTLSLPVWVILFLVFYKEGCESGLNCKVGLLAAILFVGFYSNSIITLIRHKKHVDTHT